MSLTPLLFLKKPLQELKEKTINKDATFEIPTRIDKDKKKEDRFFDLLLELCKEGLVSKISKEKMIFEEEASESIPNESPFILPVPPPVFSPCSPISHSSTQISTISSISDACLQIIDKLCSEMIVMDAESCVTTTFVLETEAFQNSPFYKATVTIEEYSTAPKVFNVSITAQESAINLLESQMAGFFELLETRNFSFAIHKIDTYLSTDSWYKEKEQDQNQDNQDQEDL